MTTTTTEPTVAEEPKFKAVKAAYEADALERRVKELEDLLSKAEKAAAKGGTDLFDPAIFQPTHLKLPPDMQMAEWARLLYVIDNLDGSVPFWLGDLLNEGEDRYGDDIFQLLSARFDYATMSEYRRVCRRLPKTYREAGVGWTHHKYVADVTNNDMEPDRAEQTRILRLARDGADSGWSTEDTRLECLRAKNILRGIGDEAGLATVTDGSDVPEEELPPTTSRTATWTLTVSVEGRKREVERWMSETHGELMTRMAKEGVKGAVVTLRRKNVA